MKSAHPFTSPLVRWTSKAFVKSLAIAKAVLVALAILALVMLAVPALCDDTTAEPKDAKGFFERGKGHSAKKDYDKAIADYTEAIRRDPKLAEAYGRRAHAYQNKGEYDRAIADSNSALELNKICYIAFYSRGHARTNKGDYDKGIEDLSKAIRLNPKSSRAFYGRGNAYAGKGDYNQAIKDYTEAIRLWPQFAPAYRKRAAAYTKQGEKALAKADRNEAQRLEQAREAGTDSKSADSAGPEQDLAQAMEKAGFRDILRHLRLGGAPLAREILSGEVEQYVRFGSARKARMAMSGQPLERVAAEEKASGHRSSIAARTWCLTNQTVVVPKHNNEKYATDGLLLVACPVPFRMTIRPKSKKTEFSDSLSRLHASWTSDAKMWFLTKEGKLRECRDAEEVLVVEKAKGILYIPEGKTTDLAFLLSLPRSVALSIARQPADFKVDLVFDQLEYQQVLDWGFYRRDKLIEADRNSQTIIDWNSTGAFGVVRDPHYFRPIDVKKPSLVCAVLVSAVLKDKKGKLIASYKRDSEPKK